jgi:caffeoyl-CoA O-methyltransferase
MFGKEEDKLLYICTTNSNCMLSLEQKLNDYCNAHTSPEGEVLYALERASYLRTLHPQMIAGAQQGKLLEMFSTMIKPQFVLEIGGFTGYSAICLAKGLRADGHLYSIEVNPELAYIFREFTGKAGLAHQVTLINGDATALIPTFADAYFDLIFLDAGKMDYLSHYKLALPKLKKGGFLIADNVLWFGKTVTDPNDETSEALRQFNAYVQQDQSVQNIMLNIRDGLLVAEKL